MENTYCIREAEATDVDELVRMRVALQEHIAATNLHLFGISEKGILSFTDGYLKEIEDESSRVVVAEDSSSGAVVGMAVGKIVTENRYVPERFGRIDDVWVEPQHRRRGLCRKMVLELVRFFEQSPVEDVVLDWVVGSRESVETWRELGFHPVIAIANAKLHEVKRKVDEVG